MTNVTSVTNVTERKKKHTIEEVITAIQGSLGIKHRIAQKLNIHRNTVELYLKRWEGAREAYNNEVNTVGDMAESVIIRSIQKEEVETAKWYARMKLKDRGYIERQEISGSEGSSLITVNIIRRNANSEGNKDGNNSTVKNAEPGTISNTT